MGLGYLHLLRVLVRMDPSLVVLVVLGKSPLYSRNESILLNAGNLRLRPEHSPGAALAIVRDSSLYAEKTGYLSLLDLGRNRNFGGRMEYRRQELAART